MFDNLTKLYCGNCDGVFSVIRHPDSFEPDHESRDVGVGFNGRFGDGEDGVWFCPFCGEANARGAPDIIREVEEDYDDKQEN
jgi:hypothetical protein